MNNNPDICHVCGMETDPAVASVEYHRIFFYFCSDQCRETFLENPDLYASKPAAERKEILKKRTLHLAELPGKEVTELLTSYLMDLMGVKGVAVEGERLHISYNLLQVTEAQIEKALAEAGLQLDDSWRERLRRAWVHDTEEIELKNLAARPSSCCNKPPPGSLK